MTNQQIIFPIKSPWRCTAVASFVLQPIVIDLDFSKGLSLFLSSYIDEPVLDGPLGFISVVKAIVHTTSPEVAF